MTMMAKLSEPPHEMTTKAKLAVWSQEVAGPTTLIIRAIVRHYFFKYSATTTLLNSSFTFSSTTLILESPVPLATSSCA